MRTSHLGEQLPQNDSIGINVTGRQRFIVETLRRHVEDILVLDELLI